jgi:hypothetical protein
LKEVPIVARRSTILGSFNKHEMSGRSSIYWHGNLMVGGMCGKVIVALTGLVGRQMELQRRDLPVCGPPITLVIPSEQPRFPSYESHLHFITLRWKAWQNLERRKTQEWVNYEICEICLFNVILIQCPHPVSFLNYMGWIIIRASAFCQWFPDNSESFLLYFIPRGFNSHLKAKTSFFKHCHGVCSGFWRCQKASSLLHPFNGLYRAKVSDDDLSNALWAVLVSG